MRISVRSLLVAGLSVTAVSTAVSGPVGGAPVGVAGAPAYRLVAAVSPLLPPVDTAAAAEYAAPPADPTAQVPAAAALSPISDFIINAYNALEPWAAWGAELIQWGMGFVPLLWWFAPGVSVAYFTAEPVVQSLVYSFAYLIDGNFSLIGPTIQAGLQEAAQNFVQYSIYWFESLIPFPPLPPWPPFPGAATAAVGPAHATRAAAEANIDTAAVETVSEAPAPEAPADPAVTPVAETTVTPPTARAAKRAAAQARIAKPAAAAATADAAPDATADAASGPREAAAPARSGKAAASRAGR